MQTKTIKFGLSLLAGLLAIYVLVSNTALSVPAFSQTSTAPATPSHTASTRGSCSEHHLIAAGTSSSDSHWRAVGHIRENDGSCKPWWLWGVEIFSTPKVIHRAGRSIKIPTILFGMEQSIPTGKYLPDAFTVSGQDQKIGSKRVFAGVAGINIKSVVLALSDGKLVTIHPVQPPAGLRKRFVWLRNMRYFVQYYSAKSQVRVVIARNFKGRIVARVGGLGGDFSAPCVPVTEDCMGEKT